MPAPNGTVARIHAIQGIFAGTQVHAKMNKPILESEEILQVLTA